MKSAQVLLLLWAPLISPGQGDADPIESLIGPSGGYTVLDFAASWCVPCYRALPRLQGLAQELPDIRVVVVSVDETEGARDRLVRELELELEVVWDEDHGLVSSLAPEGFPATYVLDQRGAVVYSHFGYDPDVFDDFADYVRDLQREVAAP